MKMTILTLDDLPSEVLFHIFSYLDTKSLSSVVALNKTIYDICYSMIRKRCLTPKNRYELGLFKNYYNPQKIHICSQDELKEQNRYKTIAYVSLSKNYQLGRFKDMISLPFWKRTYLRSLCYDSERDDYFVMNTNSTYLEDENDIMYDHFDLYFFYNECKEKSSTLYETSIGSMYFDKLDFENAMNKFLVFGKGKSRTQLSSLIQ